MPFSPVCCSVLHMWPRAPAVVKWISLVPCFSAFQHFTILLWTNRQTRELKNQTSFQSFPPQLSIQAFPPTCMIFTIIANHLPIPVSISWTVLWFYRYLPLRHHLPGSFVAEVEALRRERWKKNHLARTSQPSIFLSAILSLTLSCSPSLSLPLCLFSISVCLSPPPLPSLILSSVKAGHVWWPSFLLHAVQIDQHNPPLGPLLITPLSR